MSDARAFTPRRIGQPRPDDPSRSARFRIRIDALGRIVPVVVPVVDDEARAAARRDG
jgi:hypothetical protein